jgi:acyl carrier protein
MTDVEALRHFLRAHFRLPKNVALAEDQELLPDIIDSFGVIEVADFVEEAYGIRFGKEDLLAYAENFRSLRAIRTLIERKKAESEEVGLT